MKTATIILMSFGLFVLIKNSQAENYETVWIELATGGTPEGEKAITTNKLAEYLTIHNWQPFGGPYDTALSASGWLADKGLLSHEKWDAMALITTFILAKKLGDVWRLLSNYTMYIQTGELAKYLVEQGWNKSEANKTMSAADAEIHIAGGNEPIYYTRFRAMERIAACVSAA